MARRSPTRCRERHRDTSTRAGRRGLGRNPPIELASEEANDLHAESLPAGRVRREPPLQAIALVGHREFMLAVVPTERNRDRPGAVFARIGGELVDDQSDSEDLSLGNSGLGGADDADLGIKSDRKLAGELAEMGHDR